jgi:hypothetical protein
LGRRLAHHPAAPAPYRAGDIFQYTSYEPGARLVKLSPPTADGTLETIFPTAAHAAEFPDVDVSGYDISFDAKQIVFSARLGTTTHFGLYILSLADGAVDAVPVDPGRDYISPIWLPGDKIMFTTNSLDEIGARQHVDEYERGVTLQVGRINKDGTGEELGPRNLSHRTFPTLVSDGSVMLTQWDHLGPLNAGHLHFMHQDMTELREGFGKEGTGAANSTLKAREISPGRFVAIATARSRTIQAGALIDIRLGTVTNVDGVVSAADKQTEARATYHLLTPDVPVDNAPAADTIGRYYDAFPLNANDKPDLLVSWADGPVESGVLGAAGLSANFGIYLLDTARGQRRPILDDPNMWDIFARPLQTRTAPPIVGSAIDPNLEGAALIGSLNAYDSTIAEFAPGSIYGVRVAEGLVETTARCSATEFGVGAARCGAPRERWLVAREGPGERAAPPPGDRQVRHGDPERAGLVLGTARRVAPVRRLPRGPRAHHECPARSARGVLDRRDRDVQHHAARAAPQHRTAHA